jgi:hypothetical protein
VAACSATTTPPAANNNLSGYPPAFRQGYADGCASAGGRATRDEVRFKADVQYAWGWRDGARHLPQGRLKLNNIAD